MALGWRDRSRDVKSQHLDALMIAIVVCILVARQDANFGCEADMGSKIY